VKCKTSLGKNEEKVNLEVLGVDSHDLKRVPNHAWTHNPFAINFVSNVWTSHFVLFLFV
jgi:hypothetical protein